MTDQETKAPQTPDFREAAEKSEAANIADESASYTNAIEKEPEESSGKADTDDQSRPDSADDD